MSEYLIKYHLFYFTRISELKEQVKKLKEQLPPEEFLQHEIVKFAARIRKAETIISQNPDEPEYRLRKELKKFRRYKQGLQRYRIMFCFSNNPHIVIYLYLNDKAHLRKAGSKSDPYEEFKKGVKKGIFSHNPKDINMQEWIRNKEL